jgi:hypothetical protein
MSDAEKIAALRNALEQVKFTCDEADRGGLLSYDDIRDIAENTLGRTS